MTAGILLGIVLIAGAILAFTQLPKYPDTWRKLPRERVIGFIIGLGCLNWTVNLVQFLLEGGMERFRPFLWPVAAIIAVASWFYLDYLFTRSLGGILLLVANYLIHAAFVHHAPLRPLLTLNCYLLGILGMILIASPFRFRDALQRAAESARYRQVMSGGLLLSGLITLAVSLLASH